MLKLRTTPPTRNISCPRRNEGERENAHRDLTKVEKIAEERNKLQKQAKTATREPWVTQKSEKGLKQVNENHHDGQSEESWRCHFGTRGGR